MTPPRTWAAQKKLEAALKTGDLVDFSDDTSTPSSARSVVRTGIALVKSNRKAGEGYSTFHEVFVGDDPRSYFMRIASSYSSATEWERAIRHFRARRILYKYSERERRMHAALGENPSYWHEPDVGDIYFYGKIECPIQVYSRGGYAAQVIFLDKCASYKRGDGVSLAFSNLKKNARLATPEEAKALKKLGGMLDALGENPRRFRDGDYVIWHVPDTNARVRAVIHGPAHGGQKGAVGVRLIESFKIDGVGFDKDMAFWAYRRDLEHINLRENEMLKALGNPPVRSFFKHLKPGDLVIFVDDRGRKVRLLGRVTFRMKDSNGESVEVRLLEGHRASGYRAGDVVSAFSKSRAFGWNDSVRYYVERPTKGVGRMLDALGE